MKELRNILYQTAITGVSGSTATRIAFVTDDSRLVKPGSLFVAVRGQQTDGHLYIPQAIRAGAAAVVCEKAPGEDSGQATLITVKDSAAALPLIASNFYGHPSSRLRLTGITGTNGKTTTAHLLYHVFSRLGYPTGLLSTTGNRIGEETLPAGLTTPGPVELNRLLAQMVDAGCPYAFMEVSSHALVQHRVAGLQFAGGVFTNLTHDHLDYHGSFRAYLQAKQSFFTGLGREAFALTNADDKNGRIMLQNSKAKPHSYGMKTMADYRAQLLESNLGGMQMQLDGMEVWCRLTGPFNAYNLLAAYATGRILGLEKQALLTALSLSEPAEGRFEHFTSSRGITGIVDYAHTPDALENVLKTIRSIQGGRGRLITVTGCGGNRDTAKRPLMASIAAAYSDQVVLTSDNPRNEEPGQIIREMQAGLDPMGLKKSLSITLREEAIQAACALAATGDTVLVAGKGHEKTQEIGGVKQPFDDKQVLQKYLE